MPSQTHDHGELILKEERDAGQTAISVCCREPVLSLA